MSPCFFRILLGLLFFFATSTAFGNDLPDTVNLSLKKAMAMAIHNNLDISVEALDSSIAESNLSRSKGIYNPDLSVSVDYSQRYYTGDTFGTDDTNTYIGLTQALPTGGSVTASTQTGHSEPSGSTSADWTDWYTSVGITLVQPLLKNFGKEATELNISLAATAHEDSLEQFRDFVIDTVYAVIRSYNRLYTLRQDLETRKKALAAARELLEEIKEKGQPGVKLDLAISDTEYAINQRLKELIDVETRIKDREATLRYLIGVQSEVTLVPVDSPSREEPLETREQAINLAMEERSDLKQLRLDLQSSELREQVAKKKVMPNLDITAGGGFRGIEDTFSDSFEQVRDGKGQWWSAGMRFSMPLGNTVAENDYLREKLRTRQLKDRLVAFEWKLRNRIEEDMRSLISARVQKMVADKSFEIAALRVEQYRKSVLLRTAKVQDLLDAENDLIYARNNQIDALEDFANGVALLWKDAGVLLERKNIHINTRQPEKMTTEPEQLLPPEYNPQEPVDLEPEVELPVDTSLSLPQKETVTPAVSTTDKQGKAEQATKPQIEEKIASNRQAAVATKSLSPPISPAVNGKAPTETADYSLKVGEFVSSELAEKKKILRNAGLVPLVSTGAKLPRQVVRLNAGNFQSQQAAQKDLQKLKKLSIQGYVLKKGKADYRLYAGSFFSRSGALKEQQRLAALGVALSLEEASVLLPTSLLTVGQFSSRKAALEEVLALEKLGVQSVVLNNASNSSLASIDEQTK